MGYKQNRPQPQRVRADSKLLRLGSYPAWARFRRRRSRSDSPPQMPNRSSFANAYSRQSAFTSHEPHTRFASRVDPPFSGKKASGSVWAHRARSCQPRSSVSVKGSRANSLTWNLLVRRNKYIPALMQWTYSCVTHSANRTSHLNYTGVIPFTSHIWLNKWVFRNSPEKTH